MLFVAPTGAGLAASLTPPAGMKKKFLYVLKREATAITPDKLASTLIVGEVSPAVLEQLNTVGSEVFMPLLSSVESSHPPNARLH